MYCKMPYLICFTLFSAHLNIGSVYSEVQVLKLQPSLVVFFCSICSVLTVNDIYCSYGLIVVTSLGFFSSRHVNRRDCDDEVPDCC